MFAEGGWTPPGEPAPRGSRLTKAQERTLVAVLAVNAVFWLAAPIGGSTIVYAVLALIGRG